MPSSTSNSDSLMEPVYERPVPLVRWSVAGFLAVVLFVLALGGWEWYWRDWGSVPSYRNSEGLWAMQRRRVSQGEGNATVLIGSSRTLSNFNLNVWEKLEGKRPIQLALEGTSPVTPMEGLADDPNFTGRLVVGVAPGLYFSGYSYRQSILDYYPKETPAQRFGQWLSMKVLEPYLAFYEPDFALFTVLKRQPWPSRKRHGARREREVRKLFVSEADRNMKMWSKLETDPAYQQLAKDIWREAWDPPNPELIAMGPKLRAAQLERTVKAVEKLKKRGVQIVFVLHPVEGEFYQAEIKMGNPRADTWDVLLQRTGIPGIHFEDYAQLQGYWLPEWSHLASKDAERYTEAIYPLLQQKFAEQEKR
jgi:hypothetical protein